MPIGNLLLALALAAPADYPPVPPPADPSMLGTGVQRTMTLLATSTADKPNTIRILFYGQSITEQDWWKRVVADLKRRFPAAKIHAENRAIGGFASQILKYPAEHDLYPFYPDLLIFHVYGSHVDYESIIRAARSRTAAEVLMQRDHLTRQPEPPFSKEKDAGMWWDDMMNNQYLPAIAAKYGCGLCDVRRGWADYLAAYHLEPKALLSDGVHLNDHGNYLMAALVGRHLIHRPDLPADSWRDLVKTIPLSPGVTKIEFDGNRIDLIGAAGDVGVTIDGKRPSEIPECYAITRPQPGPWSALFLGRVDHDQPLVAEDWTLTVNTVEPQSKAWSFTVNGSVTGPDGGGRSDAVFVSKSGRVKIEPAAWFRPTAVRPKEQVPIDFVIRWRAVLMGADVVRLDGEAVTAAQGFPNGRHTLELTGPGATAVRVSRPAR